MNKRILLFTDNYPYGRSETFLGPELEFIVKAFEKVTIFPIEKGREKIPRIVPEKTDTLSPVFNEIKNKRELLFKGIFNTSPLFCLIREGIRSGSWKSWSRFRIWLTHLLMVRSLMAEIQKRNLLQLFNTYDLLYFYWGLRWSQVIPFLSEHLRPKILVRFHGSDLYEHTNKGYIPWRFQQLGRISCAIAISDSGRNYIESQYPFLKGKLYVSRIGTANHGINPFIKSDLIRIVSCSNLVPVKRINLLAEALGFVKSNVEWTHFGDGPMRSSIEGLCSELPGNIKWELNGAVEHEELMHYYSTTSTDLFINTSSSEGVPVSIMEAMSFGIPVIATDVGGTSEIVSEKTGILIGKDFKPEELAQKIEELAKRPDHLLIRKAAREEWEIRSNEDKVYPDFIDLLLQA